jgi:predicted nucleic acid-binding protein
VHDFRTGESREQIEVTSHYAIAFLGPRRAARALDTAHEVRRALALLRVFCPEPVPLTVDIHERAWDIAVALHAGAKTLYSGDMRDGQSIDGLTILDPFSRRA